MASDRPGLLQLRLFGPFSCHLGPDQHPVRLGAKHSALLAMLATAPEGTRTRSWLQDALWSLSGPEHGRASLRQALAVLKREFGEHFGDLIDAEKTRVTLLMNNTRIVGVPKEGQFFEGIEIPGEDGFEQWLYRERQSLALGRPVLMAPGGRATAFPPAVTLRPTIAVLPFVWVGETGRLDLLGDMLASDVARQMSRAPGLDVISHLSCRHDTFRESGLLELKNRFKVDYLATGHTRRRGDAVLIDVDFVEVNGGRIAETRSFRTSLASIVEGDTECAGEIAHFLARSIFNASIRAAALGKVGDVATHTLLMSAIALMHRLDLASFSRARQHLEEITRRGPGFSQPWAWLAKWYVLFVAQGWSDSLARDAAAARDSINRALAANPACSFSQAINGLVEHQLQRDYSGADKKFDQALAGDENNALAWLLKGTMYAFEGRGAEAVAYTNRAKHLSPLDPSSYFFSTLSAAAYLSNHDYRQGLAEADKAIALNPNHISSYRARVVALHGLERFDEARAAAQQLLRLEPDLTVERYLSTHAAAGFTTGQEWALALRDSGIPKK